MSARVRKILWGAFIVGTGLILFALYQRYALGARATDLEWTRDGVVYRLLAPTWFGVLLVTPLLLFGLGRSLADLPWQQRVLSLLFRLCFLALLALGLARLVRSEETRRITTVVLADVSDSVTDEALEDARKEIERVYGAKGEEDQVKLVTFAKRPRLVSIENNGALSIPSVAELRHAPVGQANGPGAGSDLAAALQLAYGVFPPGYLKRALILSDGVETEGDVLAEAGRARGFGVKLYAIPYRRPAPAEVAVAGLRLPAKVDVGQTFNVTAALHASRATKVRARLYQGEALNGLDGVREIELRPGKNEVEFKSVVRVGGEVTYQLAVEPLGEDKFKDNNGYSATLEVPGRPAVLYVEGQPRGRARRAAVRRRRADRRGVPRVAQGARALRFRDRLGRATRGAEPGGAGAHRALRARSRRRLLVRGRRSGLRPRRLGAHHHRATLAGAHGRRAPERDARRRDGARHRPLGFDDRLADGDGEGGLHRDAHHAPG
jgi:Ca-activated chloride channel family protein